MRPVTALMLLVALTASADERPDFLGFQIGCTREEWSATMQALWPKAVYRNGETGPCVEKRFYGGNHRLNRTDDTGFVFSKDKLIGMGVTYRIMDSKEASGIAETLVTMAEAKYGKMNEEGFVDKKWTVLCAGMAVMIQYTMNIIDKDEITVSTFDVSLFSSVIECTDKAMKDALGKF